MQAIETKYLGPTNTRGARIVAKCDARRMIGSWDYGLNTEDNHRESARALCALLGWEPNFVTGWIGSKAYHVLTD